MSSTNFTWSILEYFDPDGVRYKNIYFHANNEKEQFKLHLRD